MVGKGIVIFLCTVVALLACCTSATAATTGILAGTVTDLDGNGIEGASVSLYRGQNLVMIEKNPQTTISNYKGPTGHYGFKGITPGKYRIVVEKTDSSGGKYTAEQQVTVFAGTVIQDIVLLLPEPTAQPTPNTYYADNTSPADGFGAFIAVVSLAVAIFLVSRRG